MKKAYCTLTLSVLLIASALNLRAQHPGFTNFPAIVFKGDSGIFVPGIAVRKMLKDYSRLALLSQQNALYIARIEYLKTDRDRCDSIAASFAGEAARQKQIAEINAASLQAVQLQLKQERKDSKRARLRMGLTGAGAALGALGLGAGIGWLAHE